MHVKLRPRLLVLTAAMLSPRPARADDCASRPATHEGMTFAVTVDPVALSLQTSKPAGYAPGARFEATLGTHSRWSAGVYGQVRTHRAFTREADRFLSGGLVVSRLLFEEQFLSHWDPEQKKHVCDAYNHGFGPAIELSAGPYALKRPNEPSDHGVLLSLFFGLRGTGKIPLALPFGVFIEPSKSFDDPKQFQIVVGLRMDAIAVPFIPLLP